MAEPGASGDGPAEQQATSNLTAFLHWLRAVHGLAPTPRDEPLATLRRWAEADPIAAGRLIRRFAGPGFASARQAAGLLLQADLRPDDRILLLGVEPCWLPQALAATAGRAETGGEATVLVAEDAPAVLPPKLRRLIITSAASPAAPPGITLSRAADWTYPSESSAD